MTPGPEAKLLELTDICLTLGQREVLHQVCLQVGRGEILTVVGPNGAGKTTLLRVALGLQAPNSGSLYLEPGARIGYMPQRLHLDATFPLSVRRFLAMAAPVSASDLASSLQRVGAGHVLHAPLHSLSGGETQRVLLARTLLRQPDLLVLDEPVQGVDVHGQVELYRLIAEVRDERDCGILMVSHDLHLVMAATDRVVCLNRHICCSGAPETVTSDPAYLEMFGPPGIRDLAVYSHDREHRHDCSKEHG